MIFYYNSPEISENIVSSFPRKRLFEKLNEHSNASLIGIFANKGFGKTTLVRDYLAGKQRLTFWYDMNNEENYRDSFEKDKKILTENKGELLEPLGVVFDNYQFATNSQIFQNTLEELVNSSSNIQIYLIGTVSPEISMSNWKAKQQYYELDSQDLAFTLEETEAFFNQYHHLNLASHEIDLICQKTHGWVASYQLIYEFLNKKNPDAAFSLPFDFILDIPDIYEYLSKEIFEMERPDIQSFLLKTSVLTELKPEILNEYLGIPDSKKILWDLLERHVFLAKDDFGIIRYHPLFRQFLYEKFKEEDSKALMESHQRLSAIYQEKYQYISAFAHALACENYQKASELMKIIGNRYNPIQFLDIIDGRLEEISPTLLFSNTTLFLSRCISEKILMEFIAPLEEAIQQAREGHNLLRLINLQNRLASIDYHCGNISQAKELLEESIPSVLQLQDYTLAAFNLQLLADCCLTIEKKDEAFQYVRQALFLSEKHEIQSMQLHTLEVFTRLCLANRQTEEADMYISQALNLTEEDSYMCFWIYAAKSLVCQQKAQYPDAVAWAQKAVSLVQNHNSEYDTAYTNLVLGQAYLGSHQWEKARESLDIAYQHSKYCGLIRLHVLDNQILLSTKTADIPLTRSKKQERKELCKKYGYTWLSDKETSDLHTESILKIITLGKFRILKGEKEIPVKRTSSLRLLQFLIVNRNIQVNRDRIIESIFPGSSYGNRNNFNVALSTLRKCLEPELEQGKNSQYILRQGDRYQLDQNRILLDVSEFDELYHTRHSAQITDLLYMEQLYQGDFFEEYPYESYLDIERERLQRQYLNILLQIAQQKLEQGLLDDSAAYYNKILQKDPYWEEIYLEYIEVLLENKAITRAKQIADQMKKYMEKDLNVPCEKTLQQLFARYHVSL